MEGLIMAINGVQGKSDGILDWLKPGRKKPQPETVRGGKIDGLVGCAPNEGDFDTCEGQALNYEIDNSEKANNVYTITTHDCEGPIADAVIYADLDGDGVYTVLGEDSEGTGQITVDISAASNQKNLVYLVRSSLGEEVAAADIKAISEKAQIELWKQEEEATQAVNTGTVCENKGYWPTSGQLNVVVANEDGMARVGEEVEVNLTNAVACDGTTATLKYIFTMPGHAITFKPEAEPTITNNEDNNVSAGYYDDGTPYIRFTPKTAVTHSVGVTIVDTQYPNNPVAPTNANVIVIPASTQTEQITPPPASIVGPFSAEVGQAVPFMAAEANEEIYTYEWSFGDGTGSQQAVPEAKIYDKTGTYTVILTVTSKEDPAKSTTVSQTITIVPAPETTETAPTPQASIIAPFAGKVDEAIEIKAGDPDEENFTYEWSYGDSTSAQGANPGPKIYDQTGTYTIVLSVQSKADPTQVSTVSQSITIVNEQKTIVDNATVDPNNTAVNGGAQVTIDATNTMLFINNEQQENPSLRYYLHFGENDVEDNTYGTFSRYFNVNSEPYQLFLIVRDVKDDGTDGEAVGTLPININLWQQPEEE